MSYFNKNKKIFVFLFLVFFVSGLFFNTVFAVHTPDHKGPSFNINDEDADGISNSEDNCPNLFNPFQLDLNNNKIGDDCEFNTLDDNGTVADEKTTYVPLAPLTGELEGPYETTGACPLGRYLSILFNLFLGIAAVLAMIMIFVGGIEYMGSELISSKESGMSKVKNAIAGLLLALASYLILNEINPKLLNICLGDIPNASIVVEADDYPGGVVPADSPYTGKVAGCPEGIVSVSTKGGNFNTCQSIATNLKSLVDDAWTAGIQLSGGGFRTYEEQIQVRIKNCGGNSTYNIYHKPNTQCSPPTAIPGTSRHEKGKAFDFNCSGSLIRNPSNACFVWLKNNAGKYGLKNYPAENWHWSVDGK